MPVVNESCSRRRIPALDGLRGIAILGVLENHFVYYRHVYLGNWGGFGVAVFFVLSGYLITGNLLREEESGGIQLRRFYLRRVFRLWPCAWTFLFMMVLLSSVVAGRLDWKDTWQCALFIRNFSGFSGLTGHFWTLSLEEQFYFVWPLTLLLFRKQAPWIAVAGVIAVVICRATHWGAWSDPLHFFRSTPSQYRADALLIGCLIALGRKGYPRIFSSMQILAGALVFFTALSLLPTRVAPTAEYLAIGAGMMLVLQHAGLSCAFGFRPLVALGKISYSLYVWQQLFSHMHFWVAAWAAPILAVSLALGCAILSYEYIEKPGIRIGSRFAASQPALAMV